MGLSYGRIKLPRSTTAPGLLFQKEGFNIRARILAEDGTLDAAIEVAASRTVSGKSQVLMRRRPFLGRHCNSEGMGICFSKAGALQIKNHHHHYHHNSTGTEPDQTGSRNKSPVRSFESPRWSVETGDKGKLGALFYKRWPFSTAETSPVLENLIGGIQNFQVRQIPRPPDTLTATTSYASSAQDTFTFLQEPDNGEDLSSICKSKTSNRRSADGGTSEEEIVPDKLDGVEEIKVLNIVGDEILLVNSDETNAPGNVNQEIDSCGATCKAEAEPSLLKDVDKRNQDYVDLNLSYKSAGMLEGPEQRSSMFEFCFPVSARWASVVNAARHSSCLSPEKSLFRTESTNDPPHSGESECKIDDGMQQQPRQLQSLRVSDDTRFSVSSGCSSSEGHVCLGCCGRARVGTMTSSSTASCSKSVHHYLEETDQKAHRNPGAQNSVCCEGRNDIINKCLQVNILPAWSRRENPNFCTAECSTSGSNGEGIQDPSDGDTFFSFPNSPSAKILEEMGLGNIIEEMKSTRMLEDLGLRQQQQQQQQQQYGQLEIDDQSPRGGSTYTMMEGGFGSPFPVLGASGRRTCPILEKKLKFFSLERATAAAVARKISTLDADKDNPCQIDGHRDVEDYGADLFEIEDVQLMKSKGFSGLDFPMKQSANACNEDCEDIVPSNTAVPLCDADSLRNLIRGAKAIRGANYRVKLLQEQAAMKVAKLEQLKLVSLNDRANCSSHQSKGMTLMKRGLLMRKHLEVKNTAENTPSVNNYPSISSRSESIIDLENKPPEITSISEAVRSIKELSIQQILKRHDKPNWQTGR